MKTNANMLNQHSRSAMLLVAFSYATLGLSLHSNKLHS